jgi:hypothetical protein
MVVTRLSSMLLASVRQELTGLPSIKTVQEPQTPAPQPSAVPYRNFAFRYLQNLIPQG